MTVAEVVIAAMILTLASLAVLSLVNTTARTNFRAEQSQVVNDRLQQEVEKIERLSYDQIALTGLPADSSDTKNPSWRVSGASYAITQDGSQFRSLVYNGSTLADGGTITEGAVDPTPTAFSSGDVSGTIYRFVVWENDSTCPEVTCPGTQDLKRVIVAIRLDTTAPGGTRHYQELQSQATNPDATPVDDTNPGSQCVGGSDCYDRDDDTGDDPACIPPASGTGCFDGTGQCRGTDCEAPDPDPRTPWTYWLTDTGCNNTTRQPITGDHLLHNTNGVCSTGVRNSSNCSGLSGCPPGAPDLMLTQAPPLTAESPLWDYATDIEPTQNPELDKGLQMYPPNSNGCLTSLFQPLTNALGAVQNDPDTTRMQTVHKWISNPMGSGFNVTLDGEGTLNLWTQSINGASYRGEICIWLFERHLNVLGIPIDTPAVNLDLAGATYFTYSKDPWPTGWTELHIPLNFDLGVTLGPTSRLGLAIQVEQSGTDGDGMQFLYDEPSYDSRLEVKTTSLLPF
jgi:hypothetical protein